MKDTNEIAGRIIDSAMKVHTALGPALLESAYESSTVYKITANRREVYSISPLRGPLRPLRLKIRIEKD